MSARRLPSGLLVVAPPHGIEEIRATYGSIGVRDGAIVSPPHWEADNMKVVSDLPGLGTRRYVNRAIEVPLREALRQCIELHDGYVIRTLGCFAPRGKRSDPMVLSLHSWGVAVDLNASTNPMRKPMVKDIPDTWLAIFRAVGWTWGGGFPTPDPMHFQWASGY